MSAALMLLCSSCTTNYQPDDMDSIDERIQAEEQAWENKRLVEELLEDPVIIKAIEEKRGKK
jgi:hypothetical protein